MTRLLFLLIFVAVLCLSAQAQTVSSSSIHEKPSTVSASTPDQVIIPISISKDIEIVTLKARVKYLESQLLAAQIEQARNDLKVLSEDSAKSQAESKRAFMKAAVDAGIPVEDVEKYEVSRQTTGEFILKRKPETK